MAAIRQRYFAIHGGPVRDSGGHNFKSDDGVKC